MHLGHQGKGEIYLTVYYCLYFELHIYNMGALKSLKCLGPPWVLIRPWVNIYILLLQS